MKNLISSILFLSIVSFVYSQPQNNTWILPNNNLSSSYYSFLDGFLYPLPTIDPITEVAYLEVEWSDGGYVPSAVGHLGAANAISGPDGNLLFFIIGPNIFDKDGRTIYNNLFNNNIDEASQGFSEIMIVPDPGNCERYYLFTEAYDNIFWYGSYNCSTQPMYAILDISENQSNPNFNENARGNLVVPFTSLFSISGTINPMDPKDPEIYWAASQLDSNGDRAILCMTTFKGDVLDSTMGLMKLKLTASGLVFIGFENIYLDLGVTSPHSRTELEMVTLTNGNYRVATTSYSDLIIFDLDETTLNVIAGSLQKEKMSVSSTANSAGVEITPDGNYVYVTHAPNLLRPNIIDCYDVAANAWVNLPAWANTINSEHQYSFIEIGPDSSMYMANANYLTKISNASTPLISTFDATFKSIDYVVNYWHTTPILPYDKRYTLPDQIDGMDYSAHFTAAPECCITGQEYAIDMFTADMSWTGGANQTWTPSSNPLNGGSGPEVYVRGEVRIPANINVTISGMRLYFHPDARVVIERSETESSPKGGVLSLVNNTVLTVDNRCGNSLMWQGVEVQGWVSKSQLPIENSHQGILRMFADTRIEHALIGAKAQDGLSTSNNKGGIIQATEAVFYNNKIDVQFHDYANFSPYVPVYLDNISFFKKCQFITNGLLNIPTNKPTYHAEIRSTNGINFLGNRFENMTPELYSENTLGYGIFNLHSKITVLPGCTALYDPCPIVSMQPNTFKSLNYGIYCATSSSMQAIKIDKNEFINNMHGVFISNFDFPVITRNNFQIATSTNPDPELAKTYGIYLAGSSGFKVEENDLREYEDASEISGLTRGIIVANSGIGELILGDIPAEDRYHNEIYKNTFTDLLVGGQSQEINSPDHGYTSTPVTGGLQWLCNDFNSKISADLYVPTGRINYAQGHYLDPFGMYGSFAPFSGARNLFSQGTGSIEILVLPMVQTSNYIYYNNPETKPFDHSAPTFRADSILLTINYNTSCPSKIPTGGGGGTTYITELINTIIDLESEIEKSLEKIDGGSTEDLLNLLISHSESEIFSGLMIASPYLSDSVLIAYIQSSPPDDYLAEIISKNSPLSTTAWLIFDSIFLPEKLKTEILALQTGVSAINSLKSGVDYLRATREYSFDESVRYYFNDTISINPIDSIIVLLEKEKGLMRRQQLCDAYISKGDLLNAEIVRSAIKAETGNTSYTQIAEININYSLKEGAMNTINADSSLILTLQKIATDSTQQRDATRAQALLFEYIYADTILHWIEPLLFKGKYRSSKGGGDEIEQRIIGEPAVLIYPNPAADQLTIMLEGIDELNAIEIDFFNLMGQKIITVPLVNDQAGIKIDVSMIPTGMYLVSVRSEQGIFSTTRVVIE